MNPKPPQGKFKKILLINPFGIGDVLFTTPVLRALKTEFPDIKIGYLCNRRSVSVLENNPLVEHFFIYERDEFQAIRQKSFFGWFREMISFMHKIKKEHFDLAIDFSLNSQYGFFSWYAGIPHRIGYDYRRRGRFLTQKIVLDGYSKKHIVEYYADLLKHLGLTLRHAKLELFINQVDRQKSEQLLLHAGIQPNAKLIGIIPGAGRSWGRDSYLKHWPTEKFAALADKVVAKYRAQIIIMGDTSEREISTILVKQMQQPAIDFTGETSVGELAGLIARMDLIITNDGGPLHMAVALGIKTISFFGPVDPLVYGPYPPDQERHIVLHKAVACAPCYQNFRLQPCQANQECLDGVGAEEAVAAVGRLLG